MSKKKWLQLDEHTWCFSELGGMVYVYLLEGEQRSVLLDTGFGAKNYKKLAESLTKHPIEVINTHGHLDHVSQNYAFGKVYLHPLDESVFEEHTNAEFRLNYLQALLLEAKLPKKFAESVLVKLLTRKVCNIPPKNNRLPLEDGQEFDLGGRTLRVIHTPGHTPGSVCLLDVERRWLFAGDTVCDEGVLLHFPHSDSVAIFKQSMEKLSSMRGEWDQIWPCHHEKPITSNFIDEYIDCANEILELEGGENHSESQQKIYKHGRIALSYTTDNLI